MRKSNALMFREMVFVPFVSSNSWRKTAVTRAATEKGDFFGAKALDKMTQADRLSK